MTKTPDIEKNSLAADEKASSPLMGSRGMLRAAWVLLAVWISLLGALALHVIGLW